MSRLQRGISSINGSQLCGIVGTRIAHHGLGFRQGVCQGKANGDAGRFAGLLCGYGGDRPQFLSFRTSHARIRLAFRS